jgi:hypothetical protein
VNVGVALAATLNVPVLVKLTATLPEELMVAPLVPIVKSLLVFAATVPVKVNAPPSIIRLDAALEEFPIPLLAPPFTRDETDKTPPLIVVMPEYELVLPLAMVHVELPDFVNAEVPEVGFDQ